MDTRIFFVVRRDNPDNEPVVVCEIYRPILPDSGQLIASHVMTIEGATVRMHDLEAAIEEATKQREPRLHCRTCGSELHNVGDCPEEIPVYAVNVNGEEYQIVAHDRDELKELVGSSQSYGQCRDCGSFGKEGEPVGYRIEDVYGAPPFSAVCLGCGKRYAIVSRPSKEVCF